MILMFRRWFKTTLCFWIGAIWVFTGCGSALESPSLFSTPCVHATVLPTASPIAALAPHFTPTDAEPGLWQPPRPIYSTYTYPPFPPLPPFMAHYYRIGLGGGPPAVGITAEGVAYALTSAGEVIGRMSLTAATMADLQQQIASIAPPMMTNFIEDDPPGVIRELDYRYLEVTTPQRSFAVTMRGDAGIPQPLLHLEATVVDLAEHAAACAPPLPQSMIEYWLDDGEHTYGLSIDAGGGVYFGSHYGGQLALQDVETLITFFESPTFQNNPRGGYFAQGKRDILTEQQVTIAYRGKEVRAFSGATIPPDMHRIVQLLAEIHTRLHP